MIHENGGTGGLMEFVSVALTAIHLLAVIAWLGGGKGVLSIGYDRGAATQRGGPVRPPQARADGRHARHLRGLSQDEVVLPHPGGLRRRGRRDPVRQVGGEDPGT